MGAMLCTATLLIILWTQLLAKPVTDHDTLRYETEDASQWVKPTTSVNPFSPNAPSTSGGRVGVKGVNEYSYMEEKNSQSNNKYSSGEVTMDEYADDEGEMGELSLDEYDVDEAASGERTRGQWRLCGDDRCLCNDTYADCMALHNRTALNYIPAFNANIISLDFRRNNLTSIPDRFFFSNVSHILHLDIGANNLTKIKDGDLNLLNQLKTLYISHNNFTHSDNFTGAFLRTLEHLEAIHVGLRTNGLSTDVFIRYPMPNLTTLYLHDNAMTYVDMETFTPLHNLGILGIADNYIPEFRVPDKPLSVYRMVIETNLLRVFPETCIRQTDQSSYPSLVHLNLDYNFIHWLPKKVCLPKLKRLRLNGNAFCTIPAQAFNFSRFPSLQYLQLEALRFYKQECQRRIGDNAFANPSLRSLSVMYNNIRFDNRTLVSSNAFVNTTSMRNLRIGHNYMSKPERLMELFGHMTDLTELQMGTMEFHAVGNISHFSKLQNLYLYHNKLTDIPDGAFNPLKDLRFLDLSNNLISIIRETTFSKETRQRLRHLNLSSEEPVFNCGCDLVWFSNWLRQRPALFKSQDGYTCANIPDITVQGFHINEQQCVLSQFTATLFAVCSGLLITAMLVLIVFFRYRWHLRLLCFDAFRSRNATARWRRFQQCQFKYDVFVSYASEDLSWVRTYLKPELEGKLGLQLCLHERDFTPGVPIVDNIALSVEASKKVLMLFSKHFARSQWCQFELTFCLSHVMDYDDSLIVTCLHDIPSRDLTSAMMAVFKTQTYLQWQEKDDDARMAFWGRLRVALHEILPISDRIMK